MRRRLHRTRLGASVLATAATGILVVAWARAAVQRPPRPRLGDNVSCADYRGLPPGWPGDPQASMVLVAGGSFTPGSAHGYADERPGGRAAVAPFFIDRTEVTNAQFAAIVRATGHVTEAERAGESAVFVAPAHDDVSPGSWWRPVKGASWRHPDGSGSSVVGRENHPVVHVTQADARAYAGWLGNRLPSEAEWEFAARGGRDLPAEDGRPRDARGRPAANYWQGSFPTVNAREDGFALSAPVGCYAATSLGLYDVIGNVWEWTTDGYRDRASSPTGACHPAAAAIGAQV
ncbi:MAG TPA: SUMF1/EgtB/PvdO family nonheme iron enzyme, partial [Polyangia bacterium]